MNDWEERTSRGRPLIIKGVLAAVVGLLLLLGLVVPLPFWTVAAESNGAASQSPPSPHGQRPGDRAHVPFVAIPAAGAASGVVGSEIIAGSTSTRKPGGHTGEPNGGSSGGNSGSSGGSWSVIIPEVPSWPSSVETTWTSTNDDWYLNGASIAGPSSARITPGDSLIHRVTGRITTTDGSPATVRLNASYPTITGGSGLKGAVTISTMASIGGTSSVISPDQYSEITASSGQQIEFSVRIIFDRATLLNVGALEQIVVGNTIVHMSAA